MTRERELLRRVLDDHDEEPDKTLSQQGLDALMEEVRALLDEPQGEQDELCAELYRTASGVVRTAHPNATEYGVVGQWWDAMRDALNQINAGGGER